MFGGRLSDSDSGEEGPHFTSTVMVMIVMATVMIDGDDNGGDDLHDDGGELAN